MNGEYFESAEISDIGRKRKNNEDACLRIAEHGIFCVADGMGGQMGGDIASETIITTLQEVFGKTSAEEDNTLPRRVAVFRAATNRASKWIKDFADEKVVGQMGSTVVALVVDPRDPRRAVSLHAGDSRLYRYRNGDFKQITVDHSAVNAMAAKLGIPIEKVPAKYQNELLRAVGLTEAVDLEKTTVDILTGDVFLICSDGLSKMLSDSAIAKIIKDNFQAGVQTIAQTLINSANEAGGKDNVTVIVVKALDLSNAPRLAAPDDEDKTPVPPDDLLAGIPPVTPVRALDTPAGHDSDDIRGDTPQTPITSDSPEATAPDKKQPAGFPEPTTPSIQEGETQTHFITRADVAKKTSKTAPEKEAPAKNNPPQSKSGFPILLVIGVVVVAAAGAIIWFAVKPKSNSTVPQTTAAPATAPAPVATAPSPAAAAATSPNPSPAPATADSNQAMLKAGYDDAMKSAQAAWSRNDFKDAVAYAGAALQKIPGDATAAKLVNDAQAQLKIQDEWRSAYVNARNAYSSRDYQKAAVWAGEALKYIPHEQTATELYNDAEKQLSVQAAADQKYQTALQAGQNALKNDDLSTANAKAQEMLALRPNDPKALDIIKQSGQRMDYESARHAYDESDYDYALQISRNYPNAETFQDLAKKITAEQSALNDAQTRLASGDYSFIANLQSQPYARKTPFVKLLARALAEQQILNQLQALKTSGDWQTAAKILADPANASLVGKPPFQAINQWAAAAAYQVQNQRQLQQATATFEEMLVWFNIKRPNDPYIQTSVARQQVRFDGQLDDKQRQEYLATISQLETIFAGSGLLNQNNRAKLLKDLEKTVAHHE